MGAEAAPGMDCCVHQGKGSQPPLGKLGYFIQTALGMGLAPIQGTPEKFCH